MTTVQLHATLKSTRHAFIYMVHKHDEFPAVNNILDGKIF